MRIHVRFDEQFIFPIDVPENISVLDFKKQLLHQMRIYRFLEGDYYYIFYKGKTLDENKRLSDYDIKDSNEIYVKNIYIGRQDLENSNYTTYIDAINKRQNIGKHYYYKIKGSNEGTVWGDLIFTDDSNIAKAAVLEGICKLGQEKIVGIKMIEGKSSYSCANKNGINSITYGSWPASYIFIYY